MATITGSEVLAKALRPQGVETMFGAKVARPDAQVPVLHGDGSFHRGHTRDDRQAMELGAHGEIVEKPHDIRPALERAFAAGKPAVVNVITDHRARASTVRFSAYST
jgi:thiamine pyrophosphate-dependent acetolactate synthase large subunit-like protein